MKQNGLPPLIRVGKIVATHRLAGQVVFVHIVGVRDWLQVGQPLFLELNPRSFIPFYVSAAKVQSEQEYLVLLEDVATVEDARKLVGKSVYVNADSIATEASNTPLLWIGYSIVDKTLGSVGVIEDIFQTGHQWLAKVTHNEREVLIPLIDSMILQLNTRNRFIRMDLPSGLLDL